jgi:hypothetical protein
LQARQSIGLNRKRPKANVSEDDVYQSCGWFSYPRD